MEEVESRMRNLCTLLKLSCVRKGCQWVGPGQVGSGRIWVRLLLFIIIFDPMRLYLSQFFLTHIRLDRVMS
jgi:hypothetical protein